MAKCHIRLTVDFSWIINDEALRWMESESYRPRAGLIIHGTQRATVTQRLDSFFDPCKCSFTSFPFLYQAIGFLLFEVVGSALCRAALVHASETSKIIRGRSTGLSEWAE